MPELLYGFADLSNLVKVYCNETDFPRAISVACAIDSDRISSLANGITKYYYEGNIIVSDFLDVVSAALADLLQEKGYNAVVYKEPNHPDGLDIEVQESETSLAPDATMAEVSRYIAAHSGLGWIGKNGLIVTKHYGPAVLLTTVFTDAPLECASEVFLSRCGRCKECAHVCPVQAININTHISLENLREMLDLEACDEACIKNTKALLGEGHNFRGVCIYACPYTKSYIYRQGHPYE